MNIFNINFGEQHTPSEKELRQQERQFGSKLGERVTEGANANEALNEEVFGKRKHGQCRNDFDLIRGNSNTQTRIISKRDAHAKRVKHIDLGCSKHNRYRRAC